MDGPDDFGTSHFAISTLLCNSNGVKPCAHSLDPTVVGSQPLLPDPTVEICFLLCMLSCVPGHEIQRSIPPELLISSDLEDFVSLQRFSAFELSPMNPTILGSRLRI
jgi:hypothetical protein